MGGVIIESFNAQLGAGGALIQQYRLWEDTFGVSGQAISDVRANYLFLPHGASAAVSDNSPGIDPINNGLRFTGQGNAAVNFVSWCPVKAPLIWGVSQFAEAIIRLDVANSQYRGGFSLLNAGDHRGFGGFNQNYELIYAANTPALGIQQNVNNTVTTLSTIGSVPANGSKVAFACDFETTPGSVRLTAWDDEVLIMDFTDATPASRQGLPGMMTRNCILNTFMSFEFLRMGTLDNLEYYA